MVLARALSLIVIVSGCNQSLFDNHNGDDTVVDSNTSGGDGTVQTSCGAMCLGDAAADFNGTPTGTGNRWNFFDDNRNRTWSAMTPSGNALVGADPANKIAKCGSAAACTDLPGALLVSTAGMSSNADPAIEFTATANAVIALSVRVKFPSSGMAHVVGLYRNSREDRLFYSPAGAGSLVETTVTVDALMGDRFYLVLIPLAAGTADIGVQFYVNGTATNFPSTCQLAGKFTAPFTGTTVANECGAALASMDYNGGSPVQTAPVSTASAFADLGTAGDLVQDRYFLSSDVVDRTGDTTTQLWLRHDAFPDTFNGAWPFSDLNLDDNNKGGVGIYIKNVMPLRIGAETCTNGTTVEFVGSDGPFPDDHLWHFVRVVQAGTQVRICLDGARIASYVLPAGDMQSTYAPRVGRNVIWTPSGAFFDGAVDDVRVFSGALPCD